MKHYLKKLLIWVFFIIAYNQPLYAAIFLNATPDDIRIKEGDPLNIPVFIVSESLVGKEIELFVYREDKETGAIKYLSEEGSWLDTTQQEGIKPALSYGPMPSYVNLYWSAFENTTGMRSFMIHFCIDGVLDGQISQGSICGSHNIYIEPAEPQPSEPQPSQCSGLVIDPPNLSYNVDLQRGNSKEYKITVKDNCNNPIDFNGQSSVTWITLNKQKGLLTLAVNSSNLRPGQYEGRVTLSTLDGSPKIEINVSLNVTTPTIPIGGGGGGACTPNYLSLNDLYISASSGETLTQSVSIRNNCGTNVSYTATVTQGNNWLTTQSSGTGTMNVTINTQNLTSGSYTGQIKVTSGSLSGTLNVNLTVTGPCTPSTVNITPSTISKSIVKGQSSSETLTIKDNCGNPVGFKVTSITYNETTSGWITPLTEGDTVSGSVTVKMDTKDLSAGSSYSAEMSISPTNSSDNSTLTVTITINVIDSAPPPPPGNITRLTDNTEVRFKLGPYESRYFYFMTASLKPDDTDKYKHTLTEADILEVRLEPYYTKDYGGDMLVRYAGETCDGKLPTLDDMNAMLQTGIWGPRWYQDRYGWSWHPKKEREDLYYKFSEEAVEVPLIGGSPHYPLGCYYILVYNDNRKGQGNTTLTLSFTEYAAK